MCGIIHIKRKDAMPARKSVLKRYHQQKFRGSEGFGYVAIKDDKIVSYQRAETEAEITELLLKETAPEILFHHRFPTSTPNFAEAAHPLLIEKQGGLEFNYFIVHNGVISNHEAMKDKHEKLGFKYSTEMTRLTKTASGKEYEEGTLWNDSEAIAIETALCFEGKKKNIDTQGAAAVIALQVDDEGNVLERLFYRNSGNPLKFFEDARMITLTSTCEGEVVPAFSMMRFKEGGGTEKHPKNISVPWAWSSSYYKGPHADEEYTQKMGFGEKQYIDDDIENDPYGLHEEDERPSLVLIGEVVDKTADTHLLKLMKESTLDDLFTRSANCQEELIRVQEDILTSDVLIADEPSYNDELATERVDLEKKKERLQHYVELLDKEILTRNATQGVIHLNG